MAVAPVPDVACNLHQQLTQEQLDANNSRRRTTRFVDHYLDPQRKPKWTQWTDREDQILLEHQQKNGNKWAAISKKLQGRSQTDIKNRFNNTLKKALQGTTATLPCETKTTNTAGIATATAAIAATNDVIGSKKRKNTNSCAHEGSNEGQKSKRGRHNALTNMEQAIQTTTTTATSTMSGIKRPNKKRVRAAKKRAAKATPTAVSLSQVAALKKKAAPKKKAASKTKHQLTRKESEEVALVEQQKQENGKFFVDHFAATFKPKEEIKNNTVTVIAKSLPKAIFQASKTNTTTSLTIAPAEHDHYCRQVGGTLPITEEVHQALTTGHGIGLVTTWWNYYHGINPENFHTLREVPRHLPHNLAGGIHRWGLMPLQSILKASKKENVWMGGLHSLDWMIGYVIANHQEELQKCGNKVVCIIIPSGDPRLNLFHRFTAPGPYTYYVNPVISPCIVPVSAEDTVELNVANAIPRCIANVPHHPTVVPLLTEEQKRERKAKQCSFGDCEKRTLQRNVFKTSQRNWGGDGKKHFLFYC